MGKERKQLHPADQERKKQKKKELKKNKDARRNQRAEVLSVRTPQAIMAEIYKINRSIAAETADDKMLARKTILIRAHQQSLKSAKEKEVSKLTEETLEPVVIKGMFKIFKSAKPKAVPVIDNKEPDVLMIEDGVTDKDKHALIKIDEDDDDVMQGIMVPAEPTMTPEEFFTEEDQEAMMFDDDLIIDKGEEEFLEIPPGINAPPGIRPLHNTMQRLLPTPGGVATHPMMMFQGGRPLPMVGPTMPEGEKTDKDKEKEVRDKEKEEKDKAIRDKAAAAKKDPLDPTKEPKGSRSTVSSGPELVPKPKISLPSAAVAAAAAFMPTSLLVRRHQPKIKPKPRRKPTQKKTSTAAAAKKDKTTQEAYDIFMAEIGDLGGDDDIE